MEVAGNTPNAPRTAHRKGKVSCRGPRSTCATVAVVDVWSGSPDWNPSCRKTSEWVSGWWFVRWGARMERVATGDGIMCPGSKTHSLWKYTITYSPAMYMDGPSAPMRPYSFVDIWTDPERSPFPGRPLTYTHTHTPNQYSVRHGFCPFSPFDVLTCFGAEHRWYQRRIRYSSQRDRTNEGDPPESFAFPSCLFLIPRFSW
ncbi:hypothetical protein BD289DRAFT_182571 [Coniella lustricola]|uniref:Uncharacterized protein n=1 Tax=Coniella lustricola TaxID=2025994 RepID=A0A2T2ZTB1_9PEZI|nr:hypothetical protein BD289DRAFT_182571 [Coniella lustricola]